MPRPLLFLAGKDPLWELAGGHSSYVRAHGRAAILAGFEPHLFCASEHEGDVETEYGVVHRSRSPTVRWLGLRNRGAPVDVRLIARAAERFARRHAGPHLLHGFAFWGSAGVAAARRLTASGIRAIPIVSMYTTIAHESAAMLRGLNAAKSRHRPLRRYLDHLWISAVLGAHERRACERSRLVLVNYDSVRCLVTARYPRAAEIRCVPYAPESAFRGAQAGAPPGANGSDRRAIVAVSRHDPRKGIDLLLGALARLAARGVRFQASLVGGGPLIDEHRTLVERLGLGRCVRIEGVVPDPLVHLRRADVFVLPSLEEGGGSLALLEAFQCGLPAVAFDCDGIAEDVTHERNGLLVPAGDVEALARALGRALEDDGLRARLAREARRTFQARFSVEALVEALRTTYASLGLTP